MKFLFQQPEQLRHFLLVIFHPLTLTLLLSYKVPLAHAIFGIESSPVVKSLFPYCNNPK